MSQAISFTGVIPILATPFDENEDLDIESFERMIRFMATLGVDGVTILGVLGESNRLLDTEREQLIKAALRAAQGKLPIIVGASHSGTLAALRLSQKADSLGADAVMTRHISKRHQMISACSITSGELRTASAFPSWRKITPRRRRCIWACRCYCD